MNGNIENDAEVIQQFGDWAITKDGLENSEHGYYIEKGRLGETRIGSDGISEWAVHMYNKTWVNPETFVPALKAAVAHYAPDSGIDWNKTTAKLRDEAYRMMCYDEARRRIPPTSNAGATPYKHMSVSEIDQEAQRLMDCAWYPKAIR